MTTRIALVEGIAIKSLYGVGGVNLAEWGRERLASPETVPVLGGGQRD